ncbi:hypothetical protein EIN_474470 [Entamoeba invadens IP1]|uniref:Kinase n=1 Tax=Entamoeba invadens IP1 TaxID=370355 RepID=A0A0A1U9P6_ENTIV|nr:hypothetical protein EIN_474470 [Entamoeba invadens IP1]ELP88845.1 hypothetical protein EIN_474470 [Entamoeba invadens IP1]|eukprot:XP_004255616.1 hypothetical protein EIN_474470 [Entamoeba invadens IP1]
MTARVFPSKTKSPFHHEFLQACCMDQVHSFVDEKSVVLKASIFPREKKFYEKLQTKREWLSTQLFPPYFGAEIHNFGSGEKEYIKMANLLNGYQRPFVLDLKIGTHKYDPEIDPAKIEYRTHVKIFTTTLELGLRFCGMKRVIGGQLISYDKHMSRNEVKTSAQLFEYIKLFFNDGTKYRKEMLPFYINQIDKLLSLLETMNYKFFGSSVLLVYDADATPESQKYDLRFIDFAKSYSLDEEKCEMEDGIVYGLKHLKTIFENLNKELKEE